MLEVPLGLAHAYAQARYSIRCSRLRTVTVRVGEVSLPAAALLARHHTALGAIVTAANPLSQPRSRAENAQRHAALRQTLQAHGWPRLDTLARDPLGRWPVEHGFFVAGVTAHTLDELLRTFEQFAVVTIDGTGRAALRWHPDCAAPPFSSPSGFPRSRGST